jgi:hypothetical protein
VNSYEKREVHSKDQKSCKEPKGTKKELLVWEVYLDADKGKCQGDIPKRFHKSILKVSSDTGLLYSLILAFQKMQWEKRGRNLLCCAHQKYLTSIHVTLKI